MRFLEKFLIAFSAIAIGMWIGKVPTTPVLLLFGTQSLALYYLFVFPFRKFTDEAAARPKKWLHVLSRLLSGLVLALALHGLMLYALGWIRRSDILGNGCILLALLVLSQGVIYWRMKNRFALESFLRALVLLAIIVVLSITVPPFHAASP